MERYIKYGYDDFIIALGYKGKIIKEYFNYHLMSSDFKVNLMVILKAIKIVG